MARLIRLIVIYQQTLINIKQGYEYVFLVECDHVLTLCGCLKNNENNVQESVL